MTRYLVTGASGMLGRDVQQTLRHRDFTARGRDSLDITNLDSVRDAVAGHDVVINTAAYTKVDDAESNENEAFSVNATGARNLAVAAAESHARLVHLSTDYVFDGRAPEPYREDAPRNPISAYGRSKAEGERLALDAHPAGTFILRTAWLYGSGGSNFVTSMLQLAATRETVSVVDDQFGQPTWTRDVARRILQLVDSHASAGIYHATNSGRASWFDFARAVFAQAGLDPDRVTPTDSAQFQRPAPRPANSVLSQDKWEHVGLRPMRPWESALDEATSEGVVKHNDDSAGDS